MKEEIAYDYAIGLETPYWIQEIRNPKTRRLYWTFQSPVSLSFILVTLLSGIGVYLVMKPLFPLLYSVSFIPLAICLYAPYRLGKLFVEREPDGKKVHEYLIGLVRFFFEFVWDGRVIYQGERQTRIQGKWVFEKTQL